MQILPIIIGIFQIKLRMPSALSNCLKVLSFRRSACFYFVVNNSFHHRQKYWTKGLHDCIRRNETWKNQLGKGHHKHALVCFLKSAYVGFLIDLAVFSSTSRLHLSQHLWHRQAWKCLILKTSFRHLLAFASLFQTDSQVFF